MALFKPTPFLRPRKPLRAKPHPILPAVKLEVFERDGYLCGWCRVPGGALDAHHVTRRSQGGKDVAGNLKAVHRLCHRAIHDNPAEAKRRGFLS